MNYESRIINYYSIFVSMKAVHLSFLFVLMFTMTACPDIRTEGSQQKLFKNHMDLPDLKRVNYYGISFQLSNLFEDNFDLEYVIKDEALSKSIIDLGLNFSTELFYESEANLFKLSLENESDNLNAVHDHYVITRQNSMYEHFTSIKKKGPRNSGFPSIVQTIEGPGYEGGDTITYMMATVDVNKKYYVFQLIGKKGHIGYLYDDFMAIIKSIQK
jgi:hypothetical protein